MNISWCAIIEIVSDIFIIRKSLFYPELWHQTGNRNTLAMHLLIRVLFNVTLTAPFDDPT